MCDRQEDLVFRVLGYVPGATFAQLASLSVKCFQLSGANAELFRGDRDACSVGGFQGSL